MFPDPDEIRFDKLRRHILRRIIAKSLPYNLDWSYGMPGEVSWSGLLERTEEYHGDPLLRSMVEIWN